MDEITRKEAVLFILNEAHKWTEQGLHMTKSDLAKNMPDSLISKLDSLQDATDVLKDVANKKLIDVAGEDMYKISPEGIFFLRKNLLLVSDPQNRKKVDEIIRQNVSGTSKNDVDKFLDDVKDLPQDEKGNKILQFLNNNKTDIAFAIIRAAVYLSTGTPSPI